MALTNKISKHPTSRNRPQLGIALLLAGIAVGTLHTAGCSSSFRSCTDSRTCAPSAGSSAAEAGDAGAGAAGASLGIAGAGGTAGASGAPAENAGEGGDDANAGSGGDSTMTADTTPPSVVSVTPANGATGVKSDAKITITFSEPVDKPSAEAAVLTSAGTLTFSWNATGTVLTATPTNLLAYATGATANSYTVDLGAGLQDSAGNHSGAAFHSSFSTLRQISQSLTRGVAGCYQTSTRFPPYVLGSTASAAIGDGDDNDVNRFFPDFDIAALPQALTSIVSAVLTVPVQASPALDINWGTPLKDLGNLVVDHVYEPSFGADSALKAPLSVVGTLMPSSANPIYGDKTVDVTAALVDDLENRVVRNNHSMYRLGFAKNTDNDGAIDCVTVLFNAMMSLKVVYLVP